MEAGPRLIERRPPLPLLGLEGHPSTPAPDERDVMTHFDVFQLPARYELDAAGLDRQFRALSLQYHPDRVTSTDVHSRRVALERTSALNEAYKVLKDPVRRAFYLLKLAGVDLERTESGPQKDLPIAFLEEVLERREALDDARSAQNWTQVEALTKAAESEKTQSLQQAIAALHRLESVPNEASAIRDASLSLARVRYLTRFLEEVEALEEQRLEST